MIANIFAIGILIIIVIFIFNQKPPPHVEPYINSESDLILSSTTTTDSNIHQELELVKINLIQELKDMVYSKTGNDYDILDCLNLEILSSENREDDISTTITLFNTNPAKYFMDIHINKKIILVYGIKQWVYFAENKPLPEFIVLINDFIEKHHDPEECRIFIDREIYHK